MTILKKISILLILLLLIFTAWYFAIYLKEEVVIAEEDPALTMVINECESITERSAAHLVAVVEFQKLEIAGRKARVFKMCMKDHDYMENRHWSAYSIPVAELVANETKISVNEALENLRRANMMVAKGEQDRPPYWVMRINGKP